MRAFQMNYGTGVSMVRIADLTNVWENVIQHLEGLGYDRKLQILPDLYDYIEDRCSGRLVVSETALEKEYELGKEDGFYDGKAKGYKLGHEKGFEEGAENGYGAGYEEGFEKGHEIGYERGYAEGFDEGVCK